MLVEHGPGPLAGATGAGDRASGESQLDHLTGGAARSQGPPTPTNRRRHLSDRAARAAKYLARGRRHGEVVPGVFGEASAGPPGGRGHRGYRGGDLHGHRHLPALLGAT
jgi:hypothetical protein